MTSSRAINLLYIFVSILFYIFLFLWLLSVGFILLGQELLVRDYLLSSDFDFFLIFLFPSWGIFLLIDFLYLCIIFFVKMILRNMQLHSLFLPKNKIYFLGIGIVSILLFLLTSSFLLQSIILISLIVLLISIIFIAFRMHSENKELKKDKDLTI